MSDHSFIDGDNNVEDLYSYANIDKRFEYVLQY